MSKIDSEHLNRDFVMVIEQIRRHLKEPHIVRLVDVKDAINAYISSWVQIVKDQTALVSKIEIFQLAAEALDPNSGASVRQDFATKLAARRHLTGRDSHLEALIQLFSERARHAGFSGFQPALA